MNLWDRIGARMYDPFLWLGERRGMERSRAELLAGARGRVLEIGAGTGLNLRHYPAAVDELVFIEHVRSDHERWARWQDRVERPWRAFADGCRCNRPTLDLLRQSGLRLGEVARGD